MTSPTRTIDQSITLNAVFAELFRSREKLTPKDVAERLGNTDATAAEEAMHKIFMADLLHMKVIGRRGWHYGITARARRIVKAVGLDGVTDALINAEYRDAMAWRPRKKW